MMHKAVLSACIALFVLGALAGCAQGSSSSGRMGGADGCVLQEVELRIRLHRSGLTCAQAGSITSALIPELRAAQEIGSPKGVWTCIGFLQARFPLENRCHQGQRYFVVEHT